MKKNIPYLYTLLLSVILLSCYPENFHGYPKKISIPAEGGVLTFHSDGHLLGLVIDDNGEKYYGDLTGDSISNGEGIPDSIIVKNHWLTVRAAWGGKEMTLHAQPLNGIKKRQVYLSCSFGDSYADIKVSQKH